MRSMTGYGQADTVGDLCRVTASVRSVNHRYLDVGMRLPELLRSQESTLRQLVTERFHRGRVDIRIDLVDYRNPEVRVRVNRAMVSALQSAAQALESEDLPLERLRIRDLLRIPDALQVDPVGAAAEPELDRQVIEAMTQALNQAERAREAEGEKLLRVLEERHGALTEVIERISTQIDEVQRQLADRFRQRLAQLMSATGQELDQTRLAQEVALLAERSDVREELDRLLTHLEHFRELMVRPGAIGKRLDFLTQEIFRELTTLTAKCRDTEILQESIGAKLLCEQLREQLQNVE